MKEIYQVIPYIDFYLSHRVSPKNTSEYDKIQIEAVGVNPIFLSIGLRYFFSDYLFCGLYYIYNIKKEKKFIKDIIGFDFSLQF